MRKLGFVLIIISIVCAISAAGAFQASVNAEVESWNYFTITMGPGEHIAHNFSVESEAPEILYYVNVIAGPPIDFYILTESDYERYLAGLPPEDDESWLFEHTLHSSGSPYPSPGDYAYVLDNTDYGACDPQSLEVTLSYRFHSLDDPRDDTTLLFNAILGLGGAFIVLLLIGVGLVAADFLKRDVDARGRSR